MADEQDSSQTEKIDPIKEKVIVIAEDDPGTGKLLQDILSKTGFEVILTTDGKEALKEIKTSDPRVIIADVIMPEMDGFDLFKELRKDKKTAVIPFFVISIRKNMEESFMGLGVDGFMAKPIQTENFLEQITALAKRPRREPEPETGESSGDKKEDAPAEESPEKPEEKKEDKEAD